MGSLLVHALSPSHSCFLTTLLFFFLLFILSIFLYFIFLSLFLCLLFFLLVVSLCMVKALFILFAMVRFTILPFNYFWPIMSVLPELPTSLLTTQPPPLSYAGYATFHSQTKGVLFYFLAIRGIPIRIRARHSLILTPIACSS